MVKQLKNNYDSSYSVLEECFSILRTNLRFAKSSDSIRVITITSPGKNEGKTTIAYGLATSLAEDGQSVLLIDCNLREPGIDRVGNYESGRGLVNILINDVSPAEVVLGDKRYQTLDIILAGPVPPNPVELIGSIKMKNLIDSVRDHYDYILLDSPAVALTPEAGILANYSDGTLMVVEKGQTQDQELEKALNRVNHLNGNILGFVFNDIKGVDL